MGRGRADDGVVKAGCAATVVCLGLFFGFFFGLVFPEVQVAQFHRSECTTMASEAVPYRVCGSSCTSCDQTGARSCSSLNAEAAARDRYDVSGATMAELQQTCAGGYHCCREECETCRRCTTSTDSKGKRTETCRDEQCNCRCVESVNPQRCSFNCWLHYEARVVLSLPLIADDQLRSEVAAGDIVNVPVVTDFGDSLDDARAFLARPDFQLNATTACAYDPDVPLSNGVPVDGDTIVVGDDLGYTPGYFVLLAFPSLFFFCCFWALTAMCVKSMVGGDSTGAFVAAGCIWMGIVLPLVILLPIATDSNVDAGDRDGLVVAVLFFSITFAAVPMLVVCLYQTYRVCGVGGKGAQIQRKLGVAFGGGDSGEMWKTKFPGMTPQLQHRAEVAFRSLDTNGDGRVSASEMLQSMGKLGLGQSLPAVHAFMAKADANKDGKVSEQEFYAAMHDALRAIEARKSCGRWRVWRWTHWRSVNKAKAVLSFVMAVVNLALVIRSTAAFSESSELIESLVASWKLDPVTGLDFTSAQGGGIGVRGDCPSGFEAFPLGAQFDGVGASCDCRDRTCLFDGDIRSGNCLAADTQAGCREFTTPATTPGGFDIVSCECPDDCDRTLQDDHVCSADEVAQGCAAIDGVPAQTLTSWRGSTVCVRVAPEGSDATERGEFWVSESATCAAGHKSCSLFVGGALGDSTAGPAVCFPEGDACPVTDVAYTGAPEGGGWIVEAMMPLDMPVIQFVAAVRMGPGEPWVAAFAEDERALPGSAFDVAYIDLKDTRTQQQLYVDNGIPGRLADPDVQYAVGVRREQTWDNDCVVSRATMANMVPTIIFLRGLLVGMLVVLIIDVLWWCAEYAAKDATDDDPKAYHRSERRLVALFCTADTLCYAANLPLVILAAAAGSVVSTTLTDATPCAGAHSATLVENFELIAGHAAQLASASQTIIVLKCVKFVFMSPLLTYLLAKAVARCTTEKGIKATVDTVVKEAGGSDAGVVMVTVTHDDARDTAAFKFTASGGAAGGGAAEPHALIGEVSNKPQLLAADETPRLFNTVARTSARVPEGAVGSHRRLLAVIARVGRNGFGGVNGLTCAYCADTPEAQRECGAYLGDQGNLTAAMDAYGTDLPPRLVDAHGLFISHSQYGDSFAPNSWAAVVLPEGGEVRGVGATFAPDGAHTLMLTVAAAGRGGGEEEERWLGKDPATQAGDTVRAWLPVPAGAKVVGLMGAVGAKSRTLNSVGAYFV